MSVSSPGYNSYNPNLSPYANVVSLPPGGQSMQTGMNPQSQGYGGNLGAPAATQAAYSPYGPLPPTSMPQAGIPQAGLPQAGIPQAGVPPPVGANASEMLNRQTQVNQLRTVRAQMLQSAMTERSSLEQIEDGMTETVDNQAMAFSTAVDGDIITQAAKDLKNAEKAV